MKISAVIIAFNEEKNIAQAIESVAWADEILVVDSVSNDQTRQIAWEHRCPWNSISQIVGIVRPPQRRNCGGLGIGPSALGSEGNSEEFVDLRDVCFSRCRLLGGDLVSEGLDQPIDNQQMTE